LREVLATAQIQSPQCPVLSNVTGCPHQGPDTIRERLFDQVVAPVRWEQCVRWTLQQGIRDFLELGPGRVLVGLVRRIDRASHAAAIDQPQAISTWRASFVART
jgi:[acyl-carrier-protein] S-malonyltransferase